MIATTVDEQGTRRAVTKLVEGERLVSCTCCSTACCMYPADQLGLDYAEADLPDSITITIDGVGGDTRTATKSGSEYVYGSYGAIPNLKFGAPDGVWVFIPSADNLSGYVQPCLFDTLGGTTESEFTIQDNFEDTYTVEHRTETLSGPPDYTFEITRESLCVWCGYDPELESEICLEYAPPQFSGQGHWTMGGFGEAAPRNNKSPVGNYNDGGSIWMVLEP